MSCPPRVPVSLGHTLR